jgi:hypothetical protein
MHDAWRLTTFAQVHVGQEFLFDPEDEALGFTSDEEGLEIVLHLDVACQWGVSHHTDGRAGCTCLCPQLARGVTYWPQRGIARHRASVYHRSGNTEHDRRKTPMDDAHEERFRQHEDILRSLTAMLAAQHAMNERVEGFMLRQDTLNAQQAGINERLTAAIERLDVTQARIETLLARMLPTGENGRDA